MKETIEREVKLAAGEGFTLPELGGEIRPTRVFISTYHDTPELALARHGITFRHRIEDGAGVWQLKLPRAGDVRVELERGGPPAVPPQELVDLLAALLRNDTLVPVARLRTRREVVRAGGAEVVDDSVAVLDHQRVTRRFREIEVELLDGDEHTLRRLEKALRRAGANGGDFTPKLYRVLDLAYPREPVEVPKGVPATDALVLRLRSRSPPWSRTIPERGWAAIRRICTSCASRREGCAPSCARPGPFCSPGLPRTSAPSSGGSAAPSAPYATSTS